MNNDKKPPVSRKRTDSGSEKGASPSASESSMLKTSDSESDYVAPFERLRRKHVNILDDKEPHDDSDIPTKPSALTSEAILAKVMASRRASRLVKSLDFRENWEEFVRTVKVHEMLKCLEAEHRKLKILRQHAEDILVKQAVIEKDNENEQSKNRKRGSRDSVTEEDHETHEEDHGHDGLDDIETENERVKRKKAQHKESEHKMDPKSRKQSTGNVSEISDVTEEEEREEKVSRSRNITDEEFEEIVALCSDRSEQKALRETFAEKRNRDKYLHNASERRKMTYDFINSRFFKNFMLVTIITSTTGITLLTFERISIHYMFPIMMLDACVMGVFVVEAALKISIYKEDYFKRMWNLLDMIIVLVHFTEITVDLVTKTLALSADINALIYFKFLKSLRALRLLRIIKFLPNLQVIVSTIFQSFLSLGSIAVLMCLFIFVFAVMGKGLFSENAPKQFGSLWNSVLSLFIMLTLDDWSENLNEVKDLKDQTQFWLMFFYLFLYILIEYFVFLNLFVAVLVDNFQLSLAEAEVKQQNGAFKYDEGHVNGEVTAENQDRRDNGGIARKLLKGGADPSNETANDKNEEIDGEKEKKEDEDDIEVLPGDINPLLDIKIDFESRYELPVEEYYGMPQGSREANFMQNALKNMTAIDFQKLIWRRRVTILNTILDEATLTRADTYLKTKKQEEDAEELDEESDGMDDDDYMKEMRHDQVTQAVSVHQLY